MHYSMDLYEFSQGDLKICQMHVDAFHDKFQEDGKLGLSNITLHGSESPISAKTSEKLVVYFQMASSQREAPICQQIQKTEAQLGTLKNQVRSLGKKNNTLKRNFAADPLSMDQVQKIREASNRAVLEDIDLESALERIFEKQIDE